MPNKGSIRAMTEDDAGPNGYRNLPAGPVYCAADMMCNYGSYDGVYAPMGYREMDSFWLDETLERARPYLEFEEDKEAEEKVAKAVAQLNTLYQWRNCNE
jgi:hypothetical protein